MGQLLSKVSVFADNEIRAGGTRASKLYQSAFFPNPLTAHNALFTLDTRKDGVFGGEGEGCPALYPSHNITISTMTYFS